ncbi:zf-HC2 domain-containing protein [candidate division WOR-3 bacterium]|nr:zf-HC2 domain-containing protein [candidate division WOR-3 bacterium]
MNCRDFSNRLMDFIEGLLPHHEENKMREHMNHCEICKSKFLQIERTLEIFKEDSVPQLRNAKKIALFPLVMEQIKERTIRVRKKRKWAYSLSFGFTLILVFIVSIIGIRNQRKTDYYTLFLNPDQFVYEDDKDVNNYLLKSLIKNDTIVTDLKNAIDEEWVNNAEMTILINELSDDEVNKLVEELKNLDFKGG